jgi:SpoVK/Ycf46/Vps4 family AAA+-type ATPase
MMTSNFGEISLTPLPTMEVSNDLRLNYGDSFNEFHEKMLHSLKNETSGLYLFSGPPGTGKSSYIKYLTSCDVGRKIVYVPGAMIEKLVAPELVPILLENRDIILVLEDAEKALISREVSAHTDMVQTILNLTSGFLGDAANVSIIATFNTDKENIDEALLRKGRLKLSYEFDKLSLEDTLRLAESLGKNCEGITEGMSLADIYYIEKQSGYKKTEEKRVGFF